MDEKKVKYRQCSIRKNDKGSYITQMSWIPAKFAKIGNFVELREENDVWSEGWEVITISDEDVCYEDLPNWRKAVKGHRESTGDSLRK